ncbi:MAG: hypothetical protein SGPRY_008037 [Prymnesium sp.]
MPNADDDIVSMDGSTLDASLPSAVEQEYESAASQHVEEDPIDLGDLGEQVRNSRACGSTRLSTIL